MINLFYMRDDDVYVFTTNVWFSSDFDSIEQLADVGMDDPGKLLLDDPNYLPQTNNPRIDLTNDFQDAVYLGTYETFDEITIENYPELWI